MTSSQALTSNNFEAQNVIIQSTVNNTTTNASSHDREAMRILQQHVAFGALYNSNERFDPPKCHPQTRTAILETIDQWAKDSSDNAKPILWLSGPAGAGKSAIAQTLIERWEEEGVVVIAFFFWRTSAERNQKTRLVPTLAFELFELFPSIKSKIGGIIDSDALFRKKLAFQLDKLVVEQLTNISQEQQPIILVIDGLDECRQDLPDQDFESQQREILEAFGSACQKTSSMRLLLVSRPETQIRKSFSTNPLKECTLALSLKDATDAPADIRLFLDYKFTEIRQQHGIEASWPTEAQLSELVRKSSGQFIYPSVAVKHIMRARANPRQSLDDVLQLQPGSADNPLAELDMLYTLVLKSVSPKSIPVITNILAFLLYNKHSLHVIFSPPPVYESPAMFEKFLFLSEGEVNSHLTDLHSVLDISSANSSIGVIHATFSEYLQDKSRSNHFFIDEEIFWTRYTLSLIRHFQSLCQQGADPMYDTGFLVQIICFHAKTCSPSKSLMVHLWSLTRVELGRYPLAVRRVNNDPIPLASKQVSTQFASALENLEYSDISRGNFIKFLQKCNIPEIEPSWWCRFLVRLRLKAALWRLPQRRLEDEDD